MDFINEIEKVLGIKAKKVFHPMQEGDVKSPFSDSNSIENWVGFKPSTTISEGVKNIHTHTWLVLFPAAFISSLVIGLNLASDGLANALGLDAARGIN